MRKLVKLVLDLKGEYVTDRMQSKYPTQNGNKMAKWQQLQQLHKQLQF